MTAYEKKRAEMLKKSQMRQEAEKIEFLSKVDKVIVSNDSWSPYISKLVQTEKGYTDYTIMKHPTGLYTYTVMFYDGNRNFVQSREYYNHNIPKAHKLQFETLEQMF